MDDEAEPPYRWMTYAELAEARSISLASATRMAFRRKWQRRPGNDGTARVAVPVAEIERAHGARATDQDGRRNDISPDLSRTISTLEVAVASLTKRAEATEERAERAEQARDAVQAELTTEREARARAEGRAEATATELAKAQERVREVEADAEAWWARSRWLRVRAAWRGRGG